MSAGADRLTFYNGYSALSAEVRQNMLPFELGKVVYLRAAAINDGSRPATDAERRAARDLLSIVGGRDGQLLARFREVPFERQDATFTSDFADGSSTLGHGFRALVLDLKPAKGDALAWAAVRDRLRGAFEVLLR